MTPEQARAIYFAGQDAVVTCLCELDAQVTASKQQIETLQRKVAQLSKNSSTSSKRDLVGEPVSRGYLAKIIQKVSQSLDPMKNSSSAYRWRPP